MNNNNSISLKSLSSRIPSSLMRNSLMNSKLLPIKQKKSITFSSLTIKKTKFEQPMKELEILKSINAREVLINLLQVVIESYQESGDSNLINDSETGINYLVSQLRMITLDIIESIVIWRNQLFPVKPFLFKGENYLIRLQYDVDFLSTMPSFLSHYKIDSEDMVRNPLIMSNNLDNWNKTNATKITLLGVELPQSVDFIGRIVSAYLTLFNESPAPPSKRVSRNKESKNINNSSWSSDAKRQTKEIAASLVEDSLNLKLNSASSKLSLRMNNISPSIEKSITSTPIYSLNTYLSSPSTITESKSMIIKNIRSKTPNILSTQSMFEKRTQMRSLKTSEVKSRWKKPNNLFEFPKTLSSHEAKMRKGIDEQFYIAQTRISELQKKVLKDELEIMFSTPSPHPTVIKVINLVQIILSPGSFSQSKNFEDWNYLKTNSTNIEKYIERISKLDSSQFSAIKLKTVLDYINKINTTTEYLRKISSPASALYALILGIIGEEQQQKIHLQESEELIVAQAEKEIEIEKVQEEIPKKPLSPKMLSVQCSFKERKKNYIQKKKLYLENEKRSRRQNISIISVSFIKDVLFKALSKYFDEINHSDLPKGPLANFSSEHATILESRVHRAHGDSYREQIEKMHNSEVFVKVPQEFDNDEKDEDEEEEERKRRVTVIDPGTLKSSKPLVKFSAEHSTVLESRLHRAHGDSYSEQMHRMHDNEIFTNHDRDNEEDDEEEIDRKRRVSIIVDTTKVRNISSKLPQDEQAAVKIQSLARGRKDRKAVKKKREQKRNDESKNTSLNGRTLGVILFSKMTHIQDSAVFVNASRNETDTGILFKIDYNGGNDTVYYDIIDKEISNIKNKGKDIKVSVEEIILQNLLWIDHGDKKEVCYCITSKEGRTLSTVVEVFHRRVIINGLGLADILGKFDLTTSEFVFFVQQDVDDEDNITLFKNEISRNIRLVNISLSVSQILFPGVYEIDHLASNITSLFFYNSNDVLEVEGASIYSVFSATSYQQEIHMFKSDMQEKDKNYVVFAIINCPSSNEITFKTSRKISKDYEDIYLGTLTSELITEISEKLSLTNFANIVNYLATNLAISQEDKSIYFNSNEFKFKFYHKKKRDSTDSRQVEYKKKNSLKAILNCI